MKFDDYNHTRVHGLGLMKCDDAKVSLHFYDSASAQAFMRGYCTTPPLTPPDAGHDLAARLRQGAKWCRDNAYAEAADVLEERAEQESFFQWWDKQGFSAGNDAREYAGKAWAARARM